MQQSGYLRMVKPLIRMISASFYRRNLLFLPMKEHTNISVNTSFRTKISFAVTAKYRTFGEKIEDGQAYIVRNIFNSICENKSFNSISVLSWMRSNGKIEVSGKGFTQSKRINGEPCNCVILQLPQEETREFGYIDDLF